MSEKRWVQHISGQGEKWEVHDEEDNLPLAWRVLNKVRQVNFYLPKSEYYLCDPPEVWRDVTQECEVDSDGIITHFGRTTIPTFGYRRRKVQLETPHKCGKTLASIVWAFIVEQKVSK